MAYQSDWQAACTNKLCNYSGTIYTINGELPDGKRECPKCGFKTLDWRAVPTPLLESTIKAFEAAMKGD